MSFRLSSASLAIVGLAMTTSAADHPYLHAPAIDTYAQHDPNGLTILSSGRYLRPVGRHLPVARFPYGLAMSRDSKTLFVASEGVGQIINHWRDPKPTTVVVTPPTHKRNGKERTHLSAVRLSQQGGARRSRGRKHASHRRARGRQHTDAQGPLRPGKG